MDRIIERKKWTGKRTLTLAGLAVGVIILIVLLLMASGGKQATVEKERLTIETVKRGPFQEFVAINGTVQPIQTVFLDAVEGGRVDEVFVEDGVFVKAGQPLARLSNTSVMLDFMNRETQIIEQINNLRNTRITLEQTSQQLKANLLEVEYQLDLIERQYQVDTALYSDKVISDLNYHNSQANYKYQQERRELLEDRIATEEDYRKLQMLRIDKSIDLMERNLDMIRQSLENLVIKAPIDGQLTGFNLEVGQQKNRGERLGQVDVVDAFKVRARVDEHYLNRVEIGQQATFALEGGLHTLVVTKVFPTVRNNAFEIELEFVETHPESIRRGQSLQLRLTISAEREALLLSRGSFFQTTGGQWVFVLTDNGEKAHRQPIRLGNQNPQYYEVLEGLEPGDRVVTSSYQYFEDAEIININ